MRQTITAMFLLFLVAGCGRNEQPAVATGGAPIADDTAATDPTPMSIAEQEAYYYVRVLQLPTARWTLYDEIREGVTYADDLKRVIVERAWGSPIWYEAR